MLLIQMRKNMKRPWPMANEGATIEKQYNWSALLLWPIKKHIAVIGVSNIIEFLDTGKKVLVDVAREIMRELYVTLDHQFNHVSDF